MEEQTVQPEVRPLQCVEHPRRYDNLDPGAHPLNDSNITAIRVDVNRLIKEDVGIVLEVIQGGDVVQEDEERVLG